MRTIVSKYFISFYKKFITFKTKCFSFFISASFANFGKGSIIQPPLRISGENRIVIGKHVFIGSNSWLQTIPNSSSNSPAIYIGDGTCMSGHCVISATEKIILEENVLLARNVYISDHIHRYDLIELPIIKQGISKIMPVKIQSGAWIGQNVVICPGVTIGKGVVIGANSVVNKDIPDYTVAVGAPAKVIKTLLNSI